MVKRAQQIRIGIFRYALAAAYLMPIVGAVVLYSIYLSLKAVVHFSIATNQHDGNNNKTHHGTKHEPRALQCVRSNAHSFTCTGEKPETPLR